MLAVLVGHVTSTYIFQETHYQVCGITLAFFLNQGVRVSVPLFLVLSGFSLGIGKQPASYLSFVGGRFRRVLPYYVGWLLVYNLANASFSSFSAWWQQVPRQGGCCGPWRQGWGRPTSISSPSCSNATCFTPCCGGGWRGRRSPA